MASAIPLTAFPPAAKLLSAAARIGLEWPEFRLQRPYDRARHRSRLRLLRRRARTCGPSARSARLAQPPAGRRRPPASPPAAGAPAVGVTPLLRLAGLIAFAILIIVLLVFWISSCQGASKKNSYKRYMEKVAVVAKDSEQIGRELNDALTTPGIKSADLRPSSPASRSRSSRTSRRCAAIDPPGALRLAAPARDRGARVPGQRPRGPRRRLPQAGALAKNVTGNALLLAGQAERLVSGDVSGTTCSRIRRIEELRRQGITGVAVPDSTLRPEPRLREHALLGGDPAAAAGRGDERRHERRPARHRARLDEGAARQPGAVADTENTVTATTDLGFAVTVEDTRRLAGGRRSR